MKLGPSFVVFILFFGLALLEAFQSHSWLKAIIFALLGVMSLLADNKKKK